MRKERVAVIGAGGREHVQINELLKSPHVGSAIAIPGNDFIKIGQSKPVTIFPGVSVTDTDQILRICKDEGVTYAEVGHEKAVKAGVVDILTTAGISTLGPSASAGILEYDKGFARYFGRKNYLPQPRHKWFVSADSGLLFIRDAPDEDRFIKRCALCDGKGALPARTKAEAIAAMDQMRAFNRDGTGESFLVEEWLKNDDGTPGEEFSSFCISDGQTWKYLGDAQDNKRLNNGDNGKNTGGMGCSNHPKIITPDIMLQIKNIFKRTIFGMDLENRTYKGILYLGGMVVMRDDKPAVKIIEFNCRPGDPEWQVVAPGIRSDLFEIGKLTLAGQLWTTNIEHDKKSRVAVAGVSKGYPDNYEAVRGKRIYGLDEVMATEGIEVYGAGIKVVDGKYYADGGRLFYVVGEGKDVVEAQNRANEAIARVSIEGNNLHFRTDIGWRDIQRLVRK